MIDEKALAYVNAYGVLGTLENLCSQVEEAKAVCTSLKKKVGLCFDVKDGPCVTFTFSKDGCVMTEGFANCTCKMNFSSPEKFNNMINNNKPGMPVKNIPQLLSFLLGPFTKLTEILTKYLRASAEDLKNPQFMETSTILTLNTIGGAICALSAHDKISRVSAAGIMDGDAVIQIKDKCAITVHCENHQLSLIKAKCENPRAVMEFATIDLASRLFSGTAATVEEVCAGNISIKGMIPMLDNINRILDRVAVYLQ